MIKIFLACVRCRVVCAEVIAKPLSPCSLQAICDTCLRAETGEVHVCHQKKAKTPDDKIDEYILNKQFESFKKDNFIP